MKALVYTGKNQLEYMEVDKPEPEAGEVLIKTAYAGICGSDLSILKGLHPRATAPLIMGHEFSGTVEAVGEGVTGINKGEKVTAEPLISCGKCHACRSGYSYVCQTLGLFGIDAPGAFAEYVVIPEDKVYKIPENVDLHTAALIEPLAVAVHAVRLSGQKISDKVLILGGGPIGIMTAITARKNGAAEVMISEVNPVRKRMAESHGFTVIDPSKENALERVNELTNGVGADIVYEASGAEPAIKSAPSLCRVKGRIIQISMPKTPMPYDIVGLTFRELEVQGVRVYAPYDFDRAIAIMRDEPETFTSMLKEPFSLGNGTEAFKTATEGGDYMRVIFKIS